MILNFSFLLSAGACYASVVGWNVWQLSLLKREIQINLGTKPIVYHLIENLFSQKIFIRWLLRVRNIQYLPQVVAYISHAPNLIFQILLPTPPIKDNCKEPYLSYCHSLNTLQVFPFLRFYLFFSPYQEASLTSHLIGIPFIPQNLLQPKGHSLQEIFPNTTAGSTPPPSNCYSLVFVFPIICNNLFIVQLHKDTENHINQMFGLIE